jgi:hypothetical protein
MPDDDKRKQHSRPWTEMLGARVLRRLLRGEPPARDTDDADYWLERTKAASRGHHRVQEEEESRMTCRGTKRQLATKGPSKGR